MVYSVLYRATLAGHPLCRPILGIRGHPDADDKPCLRHQFGIAVSYGLTEKLGEIGFDSVPDRSSEHLGFGQRSSNDRHWPALVGHLSRQA